LPALLSQTETANCCCDKALSFFKDSNFTADISYRQLVRQQLLDAYCKITKTSTYDAFKDLDLTLAISFPILAHINYKFQCTTLCPFPICLDELKATEYDLILNWRKIDSIFTWLGLTDSTAQLAKWHCVKPEDVRRWVAKRKKLEDERIEVYEQLQPFLKYL
jgi:hypothetical protein